MVATMRLNASSSVAAPRFAGRRLNARCPAVIVRAERDDNVGSKVADKVNQGLNQAGEAAERAGSGNSPLADTPLAKALRGVEANQRQQWEKSPPAENLILPAFTRNREINAGRLAMLGFTAAYIGEIITPNHLGIIGQVSAWTGVSSGMVGTALVGLIVANLLGGVLPFSSTWDDDVQRDNAKRNSGPTQGNLGSGPKQFLNITSLGFTKQNELFNGRMAQLGFLAALTGEVVSGHGPIGQVAKYFDLSVGDELYANAKVVLGLWTLFLLASAAVTGNWGQKVPGDDNVY